MQYFAPEDAGSAAVETAATSSTALESEISAGGVEAKFPVLTEMKELLESFREEMQLDRGIAGKQNMLSEQAAAEKARLFEEILEEYM